jgi:hypothetical protein
MAKQISFVLTVSQKQKSYNANISMYNSWMAFSFHQNQLQLITKKAIPLQAWTGPEGSRRLRYPDFKTVGTGWR